MLRSGYSVMPSLAEHCQYASDLLADAAGSSNPITAGELIWGAVIQASHAVQHRHPPEHHHRGRSRLQQTLPRLSVAPSVRDDLQVSLDIAMHRLHGNFYRPWLMEPAEQNRNISVGIGLVERLLSAAAGAQ